MNFLRNDENVRITEDGFIWKVLPNKSAKMIFVNGSIDLYILFDDVSEILIKTFQELWLALEQGNPIGIKVGKLNIQQIPDLTDLFVKKEDEV
jgi:hypothetical protein